MMASLSGHPPPCSSKMATVAPGLHSLSRQPWRKERFSLSMVPAKVSGSSLIGLVWSMYSILNPYSGQRDRVLMSKVKFRPTWITGLRVSLRKIRALLPEEVGMKIAVIPLYSKYSASSQLLQGPGPSFPRSCLVTSLLTVTLELPPCLLSGAYL